MHALHQIPLLKWQALHINTANKHRQGAHVHSCMTQSYKGSYLPHAGEPINTYTKAIQCYVCTLAGHYNGCRQLTWRLFQQPLTLVAIAPTLTYPAVSLVCGCSLHWGNTEPMSWPLYRVNTPEQTHNTECNYNHSINSKTSFETIPYSVYNNNLILYSSSIPHYANKCNRSCVRTPCYVRTYIPSWMQ